MPVVVDTSAAFALLVTDEPDHVRVREALAAERSAIALPQPVVVETCQLLARRIGPHGEATFLRGLQTSDWRVEPLEPSDLSRAAELLEQYADARLGFVDASVVAIAERLGARRIYTLDRRDFTLVRPRHTESFEILP